MNTTASCHDAAGEDENGKSLPCDNGGRLALPSSVRIRTSGEFQKIYNTRASSASNVLIVYARQNGRAFTRFGVSVGRKHGGAVQRNRIKRLLREAFRLTRRNLPAGYDLILIPRPTGPHVTLARLLQELPQIVQQAVLRADRKASPDAGTPSDSDAGTPSASDGGTTGDSGGRGGAAGRQ